MVVIVVTVEGPKITDNPDLAAIAILFLAVGALTCMRLQSWTRPPG
jgi:hypothetical protein